MTPKERLLYALIGAVAVLFSTDVELSYKTVDLQLQLSKKTPVEENCVAALKQCNTVNESKEIPCPSK